MKKISSILQFIVMIILACLLFSCGKGTVEQPPEDSPNPTFINLADLKDSKLLVKAIASKNMAISIEVKHKGDIWDSPCVSGEKKKKGLFEEWVSLVGPGRSTPEDSEYTIRIRPKNDRMGERGYKYSVILDTTPPTIEIFEPVNNFESKSSTITVIGTTENLSDVVLFVNEEKWPEEKKGPDFKFEDVTLKEVNKIYIEVTDRAKNKAESEIITVLGPKGIIPPPPSIISPRDKANINLGQDVFVEGTAASGAAIEVYVNDEKQAFGVSVNGKFRVGPVILRDIDNTIYILADKVKSRTITVVIEPKISSPQNRAQHILGQEIFVKGTAVSGSTVEAYVNGEKQASGTSVDGKFQVGPITLRAGENTIYVLANQVKSKTITVFGRIDSPPFQLSFPPDNYIISEDNVQVQGSVRDNQVNIQVSGKSANISGKSFTANVPLLKEGENLIPIRGDSESVTIRVIRDTIPPEFKLQKQNGESISITNKQGTNVAAIYGGETGEISLKIIDGGSEISQVVVDGNTREYERKTEVSLLLSSLNLSIGTHTIEAKDAALPNPNSATLQLTVVEPHIGLEITQPQSEVTYTRDSEIQIVGQVYSSQMGAQLEVNGKTTYISSPNGSFSTQVQLNEEREYKIPISISYKDIAKPITKGITVIRDVTPPKIQASPVPQPITKKSIELTGQVMESNLEQLFINGEKVETSQSGAFRKTVSGLKAGRQKILITATDKVKYSTTEPLEILVDLAPPNIEKATVSPKTVKVGESVKITGKATDDTQVTSVKISGLKGIKPEVVPNETGQFDYIFKATSQQIGDHSLLITAFDLANRSSESRTIPLQIIGISPKIEEIVKLIRAREYPKASDLCDQIQNSDTDYIAALWNIVMIFYYDNSVVLPDEALKTLDKIISQRPNLKENAYVLLYRGIARYKKWESGDENSRKLEIVKPKNTLELSAEDLMKADTKRRDFDNAIENVAHPNKHKNIHDALYYAAISYYRLYKYSSSLRLTRAENDKQSAITWFRRYFEQYPFKTYPPGTLIENMNGKVSIPPEEQPYYSPKDFEPFFDRAHEYYMKDLY